ncbi:GNAT family N-acetyltransferase [Alkalihalobacillus sp. FSL R5-0424]
MNQCTWNILTVTNASELNDAFSVREKVFVEEQGVSSDLEKDALDATATHYVLYDQSGQPAGAARTRHIDTYAKVERVCISKDLRGQGAGVALMNCIERELLMNQKIPTAKLNAQVHAVRFYEHLGYTICSDEFMDAGIPHVTMKKQLVNTERG